jgi:hypothetical protein
LCAQARWGVRDKMEIFQIFFTPCLIGIYNKTILLAKHFFRIFCAGWDNDGGERSEKGEGLRVKGMEYSISNIEYRIMK